MPEPDLGSSLGVQEQVVVLVFFIGLVSLVVPENKIGSTSIIKANEKVEHLFNIFLLFRLKIVVRNREIFGNL